jgi:hypothetical protein
MKMDLHYLMEHVARQLYFQGGKVEGRDLDNWLEAERIVSCRFGNAEDLDDLQEENPD